MPLAAALLALLVTPVHGHADYQDGLDAHNRGDYATAMREWRAVTDGPASAVNPAIYVEAHYAVAMLYWQGEGVAPDFRQAHDWLVKAAELGHADAQAKLGFLYADGKGVVRDHQKAFEWFSKAAKGGSVDGLYNLGIFYLYGWGVEQDTTMAAQYLAAAAAQGDEAAEEALSGVLAQIEEASKDPVGTRFARDKSALKLDEEAAQPAGEDARWPSSAASSPAAKPQYPLDPSSTRDPVVPTPDDMPRGSGKADVPDANSPLLDESWIRQQDPQHYTIQVITLSSLQRLEELVRGFEEAGPFAFYVEQMRSKPVYVLVQGSYPDEATAREASARFPQAIQREDELWIRRFDGVQDSLE